MFQMIGRRHGREVGAIETGGEFLPRLHAVPLEEDLEDAVAENEQPRPGLNALLRRHELRGVKTTNRRSLGGEWNDTAAIEQDRGRMATARVTQLAGREAKHSVPHRKVKEILRLDGEGFVQSGEDCGGLMKISPRQSPGAQRVQHGNREQGCANAVTAHVEQINREVIFIEPMMSERIAAELLGRMETPFAFDPARQRRRQQRGHIARSFREFSGKPLLDGAFAIQQAFFFQASINARAQQHRLERLGEIIRGTHLDALRDARDLVRCGEHDGWKVTQRVVGLCRGENFEAVHLGHLDIEKHEVE